MKTIISSLFITAGLFYFFVGALGILRLPDIFTRAHSASLCDTLGALSLIVGLIIYCGFNFVSLKMLLIIIFIWLLSPTATHHIIKAEYLKEPYKHREIGGTDVEAV
ncbi:Na(+)/H(+) antiporter subunit G1 [Oxobacter pfennigii]|uniref:Na(+)/H(+) antiporter subunit G1 n=1 Tax=Oxobacter pfennigii TaxID=36849 RepID=A0A0P8YRS3_9CLOT|nr:monovalent cation/H(+) antiporter subunit G [Oxobacter pfennigii]KPU42305.1 Na(+)/H(+) antiporter subunit G1 [Oxobacter pfennigii]